MSRRLGQWVQSGERRRRRRRGQPRAALTWAFGGLVLWAGLAGCDKHTTGTPADGQVADASGLDGGSACGNGVVDDGEFCDTAIPDGAEGACPARCTPSGPCETALLTGIDCQRRCLRAEITNFIHHDGCCPSGGDALRDSDCPAACGNGVVEPGETCDPPESCPTGCEDGDSCTTDDATGTAEDCTFECVHTAITACASGDGCCPPGCTAGEDDDCSRVCGNGVIEPGETCDPPGSCPTSCDDTNDCTADALTGSPATCDAACAHTPITACTGGDGCCPAGCNANNDADCSASCGNGVVEAGETCDPPSTCPTSCDDGDVCTTDTLSGSPANCNAACSQTPITSCTGGDGCCPAGCNANNDADCTPICGNSVVEPGETCDPPSACPSCDDGDACTADGQTGSAATCDVLCSNTPITSCTGGDGCCPAGCNANNDADCTPRCGNNVVEAGEQCDDGNTTPGDGCDGNCQWEAPPPTAYRVDWLALRDPHVFVRVFFCFDVTDSAPGGNQSVNEQLNDAIQNDGDGDGYLDLSLVIVYRPLDQTPTYSGPADFATALCTDPMATTVCDEDPANPLQSTTYANLGSGTCLAPYPGTTSGYTPAVGTTTAPPTCFGTNRMDVALSLAGTPIVLHDAEVAAVYQGDPATNLISGLIRGFMTEAEAQSTPVVINGTTYMLSDLLQPDACGSGDDRDVGLDGVTPGWWFYLNFTAVPVTWVGP